MFNVDVQNPAQNIYYIDVKLNIHMAYGIKQKTRYVKKLHINTDKKLMNTEVTIAAYNGDMKWCMNKSVHYHNLFIRQPLQQNS